MKKYYKDKIERQKLGLTKEERVKKLLFIRIKD